MKAASVAAARFASGARRVVPLARHHAASSTHYLATAAAMRIFGAGGNAIDAGVAGGLALNIVERHLTDVGGVAPIMVFQPGMDRPVTIDGVGTAPASLTLARFVERYGTNIPPGLPRTVVPAAIDAWLTALARYGRLSLATIAGPLLELTAGFPVFPRLALEIADAEARVREWPASARVFLRDGRPPEVGELLVQDDLGDLLTRLVGIERANAHLGRERAILAARDEFYRGSIAHEIDRFMRSVEGALTAEDLGTYRVRVEPALHTTYRGFDVYACGPWSQGPLLPLTLNLLEGFDVGAFGAASTEYLHYYAEAFKLACADREGFCGDPQFVDVPIRGLLDKAYAEERRALIDRDRAWPQMPLPGNPWSYEGRSGPPGFVPQPTDGERAPDTSYVCAMDDEGNVFSATPSDSGLGVPLIPGLGIIASTRGGQFWLDPAHPAALAPGKRPRLTPNPAMLFRDGAAFLSFGCPGDDAQCQAMAQVTCAMVDFGMSVQEAIEYPRVVSASFPNSWHPHAYQPGVLGVEARIDPEVRRALASRGHRVVDLPEFTLLAAGVCAVYRTPSGAFAAGADPRRRDSYAAGW